MRSRRLRNNPVQILRILDINALIVQRPVETRCEKAPLRLVERSIRLGEAVEAIDWLS